MTTVIYLNFNNRISDIERKWLESQHGADVQIDFWHTANDLPGERGKEVSRMQDEYDERVAQWKAQGCPQNEAATIDELIRRHADRHALLIAEFVLEGDYAAVYGSVAQMLRSPLDGHLKRMGIATGLTPLGASRNYAAI